jgi:hypothetical protein
MRPPQLNSLTHSLTIHSLTRSLTYSLSHSLTHPHSHSLTTHHPFTHSPTHPLARSPTHPLIHSPTRPLPAGFEEALAIRQRVYGDRHHRTVAVSKELKRARRLPPAKPKNESVATKVSDSLNLLKIIFIIYQYFQLFKTSIHRQTNEAL